MSSSRPLILLVDDDTEVLKSVERDIRGHYAASYRVLTAASGADALSIIDRLTLRDESLALVIADQRMPGITGTELLESVSERVPGARRILLTAYADTEAAIAAINRAHIDYYILKPWDPPEEKLFPVMDDLLEEWQATSRPVPDDAIRVVGDRWSADSHDLRQFLSSNHVPFRWLEIGQSGEAERLLTAAGGRGLPLAVLTDGDVMTEATPQTIASAVGLTPQADAEFHDLVVVGAGPAGLAAAVYGASEGLSTMVIEAQAPGGQAGTSSRIENYLGFPQGVSGEDLARRALTQARRFGASFVSPRMARRLHPDGRYRVLELDDGEELRCSVVIISTGVQYRELDVPGAERLKGRGLYYGSASSEAAQLKGEAVVVIGGANSAGQAAVHLSRFAGSVTMLVRGDSLEARMSQYLVDQIEGIDNIDVRLRTELVEVRGDSHLEQVVIDSDGTSETRDVAAAFIFIGARPRTDWLETIVARDERGFILTGSAVSEAGKWSLDRSPMLLETSMPGVFGVGDVRAQSIKRVASAVGEGSVAVQLTHAYLSL